MDHKGFIEFFQHFVDTDELIGQFTEEQTIILAKQAQAHEQMANALKAAQAQAANAAQMQRNAQLSQQQAPAGGNPSAPPAPEAPPQGAQ
jgi:hypothetical protein